MPRTSESEVINYTTHSRNRLNIVETYPAADNLIRQVLVENSEETTYEQEAYFLLPVESNSQIFQEDQGQKVSGGHAKIVTTGFNHLRNIFEKEKNSDSEHQ